MEKEFYKPTIKVSKCTKVSRKPIGNFLLLLILGLSTALPTTSEGSYKSKISSTNRITSPSPRPNSSEFSSMQSIDEKSTVLQKCINLTELQPFYSKNPDGSFKQLNIMQHGISFATDNSVAHAGKSLAYLSKEQIKSRNIDAYFYFHELKIEQNSAKVDFVYNYDQSTPSPKRQVVSLELEKTADGWNVAKSKMEVK